MSLLQKRVMQRFFRDAEGDCEKLPWHSTEPSPWLERILSLPDAPARALDVGCGSGYFSAWMAARGLDVTGLDYLPEAIAMARELAAENGVDVSFREADVLDFTPERPFELVLDSGCMHNMSGGELDRYRAALLRWLAPGGHFVLGHWGRRGLLDWRPIGPRRRRPAVLERLLGHELELVDFEEDDERVPLPFGPWVRMASYWFRRT